VGAVSAGGFSAFPADHRHVLAIAAHRFAAFLRDLALRFRIHACESAIARAAGLVRHAERLVLWGREQRP
jgi:hypothetical protein